MANTQEPAESELKRIERELAEVIKPLLLKAASEYIAHIDEYALASIGKPEMSLRNPYRGRFIDFRQEPREGGKRVEVTYAGESLEQFLKAMEAPTAFALVVYTSEALKNILRERHGEEERRKESDSEIEKSMLFGGHKEYWFQQRYVSGQQYPGSHHVLLKRIEDAKPPAPKPTEIAK